MNELDLTPQHQTFENLELYREYVVEELNQNREPLLYSDFVKYFNE